MRKKTAVFCIILMILLLTAGVVYAEDGFAIYGQSVIPAGACFDFSADAQGEVTWTSSDASVAEVSETGRVTGMSAGSCTIFADDGDTVEGFDVRVTDGTVSGVKVGMKDALTATVSWTAAEGVSGYRVYRSKDGVSYKAVKTLAGADTLSYENSVTCGVKYYYRVRSYTKCASGTVWGGYSKAVSLTAKPAAPALNVKAKSNTSLSLSWTGVNGATAYELYRAETEGGSYKKVAATASTAYTDSSLTAGRVYYYKVRAYRTVGGKKIYGGYGEVVSKRCGLAVPASFGVTAGSSGNTLSWKGAADAQRYQVFRKLAGESGYTLIARVEADELSYLDTTAPVGKAAEYRIRAYAKVDGVSIYGSYTSTLKAYRRPAKTQLTLAVAGSGKVKASWAKVSGATLYALYRSEAENGTYKVIATVTGTSYTDGSLSIGTTYYYKVLPMTKYAGVTTKGYFSAKGAIVASPAKVGGMTAQVEGNSRIKLTWNSVTPVTGYAVYRSEAGGEYKRIAYVKGAQSYTDSDVKVNVEYQYYVKAYKKVSGRPIYGPQSSAVKGSVLLGTSSMVSVKATDYTRLTIKWTAAENAAGYQIWRKSSDDETGKWVKVKSVGASVLSYVDDARKSGVKYTYKIRPYGKTEQGTVYGLYTDEFAKTMPVKYWGIDVSKWQGEIDWQAVKESGISFVMIRASYTFNDQSAIVTDERFYENIEGAKAAGLKVGLYAYCTHTTRKNVINEAEYILDLAKDYELDLPIAYDYERKDVEDYTEMARAFCETIEQAGYSAAIYATPAYFSMNGADTHLDYSQLSTYPQWVARYRDDGEVDFSDFERVQEVVDRGFYNPDYPEANEDSAIMWQYTSKGRVEGISGLVDLNIMYF